MLRFYNCDYFVDLLGLSDVVPPCCSTHCACFVSLFYKHLTSLPKELQKGTGVLGTSESWVIVMSLVDTDKLEIGK